MTAGGARGAGAFWRPAGAILLLALSAWHFGASAWRAQSRGIVDFPIFAARAAEFLETGVLYPGFDDPATWAPAAPVYKFPPFYALLLLPFVRGGVGPSLFFAHWFVQLALFAAAVALLLWGLRPARPAAFVVLGLAVALNHEPFFETLWRQQAETLLLLLLAVALVAVRRGRAAVAGGLVGAMAMLKVYPAALLAFFVVRRRWDALLHAAAAAALVTVSTLIVFGWRVNEIYYLHVLPRLLGEAPVATTENLSLARYAQTLLGLAPGGSRRLAQGVGLLLLVLTLVAARGRRGPQSDTLLLGAFVPLGLLLMPNAWVNYQLLLLVPLLAVLAFALRGASADRRVLVPALVAATLFLFYWPCAAPEAGWPCAETPRFLGVVRLPRPLHDAVVAGRVLATLAVWAAAVLAIRRGGDAAPAQPPGSTR